MQLMKVVPGLVLVLVAALVVPATALAFYLWNDTGSTKPREAPQLGPIEPAAPTPVLEPPHVAGARQKAGLGEGTSREQQQLPPAPSQVAKPVSLEERAEGLEYAFQLAQPALTQDLNLDRSLRGLFEEHELEALECRGSHCRVKLTFESKDEGERRLTEAFIGDKYDLHLAGSIAKRTVEEDGSFSALVYLYPDESTEGIIQSLADAGRQIEGETRR